MTRPQRESQHEIVAEPEKRIHRAVRLDGPQLKSLPLGELLGQQSAHDLRGHVDLVLMHFHGPIMPLAHSLPTRR